MVLGATRAHNFPHCIKFGDYTHDQDSQSLAPQGAHEILLLEGISETAVAAFTSAGFANVVRLTKALDGAELIEALQDVRILGIRSRTHLTSHVIERTDRLIAVGCFSVGTNQVDLAAANAKAVPVFNAPFSNTRSVAELTIAEIVMLFRRIFPRSVGAHAEAGTRAPPERMRYGEKPWALSGSATSAASLLFWLKRWGCA